MKRFLLIGSGILALLVIAALSVPFFIPKSVYKAQIEKAATNALQRDVTLAGEVDISVFPRISATVRQVSVANPEGFATPNMIEAGELRGSVKWMPLLSRRVDVQELAFVDAQVLLQKRGDGRTNWEFAEAGPAPAENEGGASGGFEAGIESAVLENASLTFRDDVAGTSYELTELDLRASMRGMDQPLGAEASGKFQGQAFNMSLKVDTPAALTGNQPAGLELDLSSDLASIDYTGSLQLSDSPIFDGAFTANIPDTPALARQFDLTLPASAALGRVRAKGTAKGPLDALALTGLDASHDSALLTASYAGDVSLGGDGKLNGDVSIASDRMRDLLAAADVALAPGETLQTFSATGEADGSFKSVMLNGLTLKLDDLSATGQAGLDLSAATPLIVGDMAMPELDLTAFMGESADEGSNASQGIQPWSKEPLDLAGLKAVNAQLDLDVARLVLGDVVLTDTVTAVNLTGGVLTADLTRFNAFNGTWQGKLSVDARTATPKVGFDMQGQQVAIANLLGTLAGFDSLTGTGNFKVSASSSGASLDDIMQALDGTVSTDLSDGIIRGLNVAALVRSAATLKQAVATGSLENLNFSEALSENAETDFSSFNTVLTINDGVANVDLMKLLSPVLGVDGSGKINLAGQSMDLRLATSIDKAAQGQGSVVQLNGIPVPVRISGPWSKPKVTPDMSGVTSALKAELGTRLLNELGGSSASVSGNAEDVIGGLLGIERPAQPEDDTGEATQPPSAEETAIKALGGLLGTRKKEDKPSGDN